MQESCEGKRMIWQQAAFERLGNAVVERAALDYIRAVKDLYWNPENIRAQDMLAECERFFCTKQIQYFSGVDGRTLLKTLREEALKQCARKKRRKAKKKECG